MLTTLLLLLLLGLVGACAGFLFFSEENVANLRTAALEVKRWVRLRLDSFGQAPEFGFGSDCEDLEEGLSATGEMREALVLDGAHPNNKKHVVLQLSKKTRDYDYDYKGGKGKGKGPIRRSVFRSGGTVTSTSKTPTPPVHNDYASLLDHTSEQLQRQQHQDLYQPQQQPQIQQAQQLPRPPPSPSPLALHKTKSMPMPVTPGRVGGAIEDDPNPRRKVIHHGQRRGISFDANSSILGTCADIHHHSDCMGREAGDQYGGPNSARGNFSLPRISTAFPDESTKQPSHPPIDMGAYQGLPSSPVVALGGHLSADQPVDQNYSGGQEQAIPEYVPSLSKARATHRRSSSKTNPVNNDTSTLHNTADVGSGGGSSGGGSRGAGFNSPPESPFFSGRSPAKVLPPVPPYEAVSALDARQLEASKEDSANSRLQGVQGQQQDQWQDQRFRDRKGRSDELSQVGVRARDNVVPSPREKHVPDVNNYRGLIGATFVNTPTPASVEAIGWQQGEEAPSKQRSPSCAFFAAPSPDNDMIITPGKDKSIDPLIAQAARGGGSSSPPSASDDASSSQKRQATHSYQRDILETAITIAPTSPANAWSIEADHHLNRSTGIRRRLSPRVTNRPRLTDDCRSPRRGAGWSPFTPSMSPAMSPGRQRQETFGEGGNPVHPRTITFIDEPSKQGAGKLKIDVTDAGNTVCLDAVCPLHVCREAKTPIAGARKARVQGKTSLGPSKRGTNDEVDNSDRSSRTNIGLDKGHDEGKEIGKSVGAGATGLKCSSPIYDRGKNLLGNSNGGGTQEGDVALPCPGTQQGPITSTVAASSPRRAQNAFVNVNINTNSTSTSTSHAQESPTGGGHARSTISTTSNTTNSTTENTTGNTTGAAKEEGGVSNGAKASLLPRRGKGTTTAPQERLEETGEQIRQGRDLSSSAALAKTLDLPFHELELVKLIGGGGFGQVYAGLWKGTPVAIKVLVPVAQRALDDELAMDFRGEVLMLAALRHPNVCLFMGACLTPPNRAIVTEILNRGSLWEALRNNRLPQEVSINDSNGSNNSCQRGSMEHFSTPTDCWPWSIIIKVAEGAACGMNYLHQHQPFPILHRDLKSANLLLDECFNVKICDFGLARLKAYTNSMTGNCGTVQWMAPEVLASEKYTETADMYSFAIVFWELLSRACPYEGMSQIQVAVAVLNNGLRPDIPHWCPTEFSRMLKNAWQQDPTQRASFEDILQFLRENPTPSSS